MNRLADIDRQSAPSSLRIGIVSFLMTCSIISLSHRTQPDTTFTSSATAAVTGGSRS